MPISTYPFSLIITIVTRTVLNNSDKDCASALWLTKDTSLPKIHLISSYWDIKEDNLPEILLESVANGLSHNLEILIGMDSNAHTDMTGSEHLDK